MTLQVFRFTGLNSSLALKAPVRCATTVNITLSGFQTIDGVALLSTDTNLRVLVKNQAIATQNGLYDAQAATWTRCADFDSNDDFINGTRVFVANGSTQAGTYILSTPDPIVLNTSNITFTNDVSLFPSGSAAAPAYSFASDPDTGIYLAAEDKLGISVGGNVFATMAVATGLALGYQLSLGSFTTTQQNAIVAPLAGTLLWNSSQVTPNFFDGGAWQQIATLTNAQTFINNQLINIAGAAGTSLKITKNSSANNSQSCLDLHTASNSGSGRLLQFFIDPQDTHPIAYFDDGTNFYSRTSATISGVFVGSNISPVGAGITLSGEQMSYMLGTYGDTNINYASRLAPVSTPNGFQHAVFVGNQATGLFQGTPAPQMEGAILQQFQHAWGVNTGSLTWDTFLGRGNNAATLQLGGWDTATPIAQHLATQNVASSVQSAADGVTAAGNAIVSTSYGLPNTIFVGMTVTDVTTPSSIPGSTTILSIATNRQSFTMSANAQNAGIGNGDTLQFSCPNISAVNTNFDGSQSTGTGTPGNFLVNTSFANLNTNFTCTISNGSPATITAAAHGLVPGSVGQFTTTGTLPTGLSLLTNYYVISTSLATGSFQVSLTPGGAAVGTSSAGSGTHTFTTQTAVQNPVATIGTWGPSALAGSSATSLLSLVQTWNTSGTPTALLLNVTSIAANAASKLADFQAGGTSLFTVYAQASPISHQGSVQIGGGGNTKAQLTFIPNSGNVMSIGCANSGGELVIFDSGENQQIGIGGSAQLQFNSQGVFGWGSSSNAVTGAPDTILTRGGIATLQLGNLDAASPVAQTLQAQNVATGTNNGNAVNFTINAPVSTGSGTSGDLILQTGGTGAGAATKNTPTAAVRIKGGTQQTIFSNAAVSSSPTAGVGYTTGAGGSVAQTTGSGKATAFTLSKVTGQITFSGGALAPQATVSSSWTNTALAAADVVYFSHVSGGTIGAYVFNAAPVAGSAQVNITNVSTSSLSESPVVNFAIVKGSTA